MPGQGLPDYHCGELRVAPALGLVSNDRGESVRLGLVNMKVLSALLAQPGRMVSRTELFEGVWPNQIVSDDTLTRCISDIRGQLRKLSGRDDWIETLPKRGYRWIGSVGEAAAAAELPAPPLSPAPDTSAPPARGRHPVLWIVGRAVAYLIALVLIATLAVWAIDRLAGPRDPIIAVLPVTSTPELAGVAGQLDRDLRAWLGSQEPIRVLARSAIQHQDVALAQRLGSSSPLAGNSLGAGASGGAAGGSGTGPASPGGCREPSATRCSSDTRTYRRTGGRTRPSHIRAG